MPVIDVVNFGDSVRVSVGDEGFDPADDFVVGLVVVDVILRVTGLVKAAAALRKEEKTVNQWSYERINIT